MIRLTDAEEVPSNPGTPIVENRYDSDVYEDLRRRFRALQHQRRARQDWSAPGSWAPQPDPDLLGTPGVVYTLSDEVTQALRQVIDRAKRSIANLRGGSHPSNQTSG